jgi:hypothetical protein
MEEAPENGKESSRSAHANEMNESVVYMIQLCQTTIILLSITAHCYIH